jgi:hypothetical protein
MKPPLFIRPLSTAEVRELEASLRSRDAFTLCRSQILVASARGSRPSRIAKHLSCATHTVRNALRAFQGEGLNSLTASRRPKPGQKRLCWVMSKCADKRFCRRCLKAKETEDIPSVKLTPMMLEMGYRDLTNRVRRSWLIVVFGERERCSQPCGIL